MQAILDSKLFNMEKVDKLGLMEAHTMVNGSMDFKKVKENKPGLMLIQSIRVNGKLE